MLIEKTKVCPKKVYNARVLLGNERIKEKEDLIKKTGGIEAIYLDERKDFTTVNQVMETSAIAGGDNYNGKNRVSRLIKEEHCPILVRNVNLDKEVYLRTLVLDTGTGINLAQKNYDLLEEFESLKTLMIFASDSCNKMSGHRGGDSRLPGGKTWKSFATHLLSFTHL